MNGTDDNLIRDLPVVSENGIDLDYDVSMHQKSFQLLGI